MYLKRLELNGFKSFAKKSEFDFDVPIVAIVGPNGSGKSNVVESIRFVLGEQSVKSMRGKTGADLIFKGSREISKMSRASVTIVFDNTKRIFHLHHHNNAKINIDFDEVVISREVFSDGGNKYTINGHEVRMKDVHELIASVNIGASGHHIISQGEADRYLNANVKDRRALIEEALGLKIYQYRLKEAKRKLEKSQNNIKESQMLRRELVPHLRFLKRQVDKIEKAKELRKNLEIHYYDYFSKEDYLISNIENQLLEQKTKLKTLLDEVFSFLDAQTEPESKQFFEEDELISEKKKYILSWQAKISENLREIGKIEGMLSYLQKTEEPKKAQSQRTSFAFSLVKNFVESLFEKIKRIDSSNIDELRAQIKNDIVRFFEEEKGEEVPGQKDNSVEIAELGNKRAILDEASKEAQTYISSLEDELKNLEYSKQEKIAQEKENQKKYYEFLARKKELLGKREILDVKFETLEKRKRDREEELTEARVLLGENHKNFIFPLKEEDKAAINVSSQEMLRREIERIKIRIEDMGGGSGVETIKEYHDTLERDQFLEKEILDVQNSIESLESVISDLKKTLDVEFAAGIEKINVEFDRFFKAMFGGGAAKLESSLIQKRRKKNTDAMEILEEETEEKKEYGIDIKVQLPRKKVSDLDMLSGGERSLTSIALLFALSQVNPPPFLVLDETDAALDEANSQKYGNMIESLSKFSQLIVVTHNRETMSRAQTLFGVTLGRDDCSTLLSLRLEDAAKYAK